MVKEIDVAEISAAVEKLCVPVNCVLNKDVRKALIKAKEIEESPQGLEVLDLLLKNADIASEQQIPICQDTGMAVLFVEVGQDLRIVGGSLTEALNAGISRGYTRGYLRKSIVKDPFARENTGDNTPAVIHYDFVPGDKLKITLAPKGFGSENMGALKMFKPADGLKAVLDFIVDTVDKAGANPCPPVVVGVGIGGTMEKAAFLAKKALLREIGSEHKEQFYADIEQELLNRINNLGIGPQGYGGRISALAVHIEAFPTHIAGLPVAVNLNCHVARHQTVILNGREKAE